MISRKRKDLDPGKHKKNSIELIVKAAYYVIWMLFLFIEQSKIMYIFERTV